MGKQNLDDSDTLAEPLYEPLYDIDELEIIYDPVFTLGVPHNAPSEFKKYVVAAAKAYYLGHRSIDYTLKKYGSYLSFNSEPSRMEKRFWRFSRFIKEHLASNKVRMNSISNKPDRVGLVVAGGVIIRLTSSFQSALLLSRFGFFFEAGCICRFILEQLAWAYSVHEIEDDSLFKTSVTRSVGKLKELIPHCGKLYGFLSNLAHISPGYTKEYILFDEGCPAVVVATTRNLDTIIYWLLLLLDICQIVTEVIYLPLVSEHLHIAIDKHNDISVNENRPLLGLISEFREKYIRSKGSQSTKK